MLWNIHGVVPPIAPDQPGNSVNRSPYKIGICNFIENYATSLERINILEGFLDFRDHMYNIGLSSGFQWVNGSFTENIEALDQRPPNDIDVVNFVNMMKTIPDYPDWVSQNEEFFNAANTKENYKVDAYFVDLDLGFNFNTAQACSYWYSMWSHQRDTDIWKGFFCIPLSESEDLNAISMLMDIKAENQNA